MELAIHRVQCHGIMCLFVPVCLFVRTSVYPSAYLYVCLSLVLLFSTRLQDLISVLVAFRLDSPSKHWRTFCKNGVARIVPNIVTDIQKDSQAYTSTYRQSDRQMTSWHRDTQTNIQACRKETFCPYRHTDNKISD